MHHIASRTVIRWEVPQQMVARSVGVEAPRISGKSDRYKTLAIDRRADCVCSGLKRD